MPPIPLGIASKQYQKRQIHGIFGFCKALVSKQQHEHNEADDKSDRRCTNLLCWVSGRFIVILCWHPLTVMRSPLKTSVAEHADEQHAYRIKVSHRRGRLLRVAPRDRVTTLLHTPAFWHWYGFRLWHKADIPTR
jgi:hypothetical protein